MQGALPAGGMGPPGRLTTRAAGIPSQPEMGARSLVRDARGDRAVPASGHTQGFFSIPRFPRIRLPWGRVSDSVSLTLELWSPSVCLGRSVCHLSCVCPPARPSCPRLPSPSPVCLSVPPVHDAVCPVALHAAHAPRIVCTTCLSKRGA